MGAPQINISFIDKARTIFDRAERGIVGLILNDTLLTGDVNTFTVQLPEDIPSSLSDFNKKQIRNALIGNVTAPASVKCFILDSSASDIADEYTKAYSWIRNTKVHFIAVPSINDDAQLSDFITTIKSIYENDKKKVMAILPFSSDEDHEAIVGCDFTGYTTDTTYTKTDGVYLAEEYCSRIAGFIAGTPFTQSITYGTLKDLYACNSLTVAEQDAAVDAGKLVLMNDGEKIKIVRGVNTLVTTTETKKQSFKKIKIVNVINLIYEDLALSIRDQYIGKYNNTYENKVVLATAITQYFINLIAQSVISSGVCSVDFTAQREWLKAAGEDVTSMSETEILEADTSSKVFLIGKVGIPDTIEDVDLPIYL